MSLYSYREANPAVVKSFINNEAINPLLRAWVAADYGLAAQVPDPGSRSRPPLSEDIALGELDRYHTPAGNVASPLVAAVSPMTETQALELQGSFRRQNELALSLAAAFSAAGLTAQARTFDQFIRSRQQDVATATPLVAVNTYSHSGGMFGFQVGPRLTAIEQVKKRSVSGPGEVLDRQTFPTLILFGLDRRDLVKVKLTDEGKYQLYQAGLLLLTAPSWVPVDSATRGQRMTEIERLAISYDLSRTSADLAKLEKTSQDPATVSTAGFAKNRTRMLRYKANGSGVIVDFPDEIFEPGRDSRPTAAQSTSEATAKPGRTRGPQPNRADTPRGAGD